MTDGQWEVPPHKRGKRGEGLLPEERRERDGGGGGGDGGRGKWRKQIAGVAEQQVVAHLFLVAAAEPSPAPAPGVAAEVDEVQCEAEVGSKVKKSSFGYSTTKD